jgi:hypothetical protein
MGQWIKRLDGPAILDTKRGHMQWEQIVRENMALVDGEKTSYRVKDGKHAVLIVLGPGAFSVPPEFSERRSDMAPFGGPDEITLDLSNSDFLIVNKQPSDMAPKFKHYIPWDKIVDIVFLEPSRYYHDHSAQ